MPKKNLDKKNTKSKKKSGSQNEVALVLPSNSLRPTLPTGSISQKSIKKSTKKRVDNRESAYKHWVFTLNNYTDDDEQRVKAIADLCTYMIVAKEVASTGTPHLQGYLEARNKHRAHVIEKWFNNRAHIEKARDSPYAQPDYVWLDVWFKHGDKYDPKTNTKTVNEQWKEIAQLAMENKIDEIIAKYPGQYLAKHAGIEKIAERGLRKDKDLEETCGTWIYGKSGLKKTRYAKSLFPGKNIYLKPKNRFFDNYEGEEVVIIEDLEPKDFEQMYGLINNWSDVFPFTAEKKHSNLKSIRPEHIIITSNHSPNFVMNGLTNDKDAFLRRFEIIELSHNIFTKEIDIKRYPKPKMLDKDIKMNEIFMEEPYVMF